jgi:hypothetical protein
MWNAPDSSGSTGNPIVSLTRCGTGNDAAPMVCGDMMPWPAGPCVLSGEMVASEGVCCDVFKRPSEF